MLRSEQMASKLSNVSAIFTCLSMGGTAIFSDFISLAFMLGTLLLLLFISIADRA